MIKEIEIKINPHLVNDTERLEDIVRQKTGIAEERIKAIILVRRSIDARGKSAKYMLRYLVYIDEFPKEPEPIKNVYQHVEKKKEAIIVGAGPAGYFAALELIELGIRPIILDRGKDVQSRRRDLKAIQQDHIVNPNSNYCFGEGGAGTYSDGKLYTRSLKRGNYIKVLRQLVEHGASPEILLDAHPHIGSNKLPKIVSALRTSIENHGGRVVFDAKVVDLLLNKGSVSGVRLESGEEYSAKGIILATGHSARDIYYLLHKKGIRLEPKDFAIGVRIEHPQSLIDEIQYGTKVRHENLPASSYRLACQVNEKGVFSFCMCPGGLIVPAATAPGELVVNGMSLSRRDSPFSNSGFVTAVDSNDYFRKDKSLFAGLEFQSTLEQRFFQFGDGSQKAPAQRMTDFVNKKISQDLSDTSYIPGIYSAPLHELLPSHIYERLATAMLTFKKKLRGYYTEEANLIGLESRTSSPIRIPRNKDHFMHEDVEGLFPCGEGAGYAGGILSAAMDGQNVAKKLTSFYQ